MNRIFEKAIKDSLSPLKNKRVIIYGTGNNARDLIRILNDENIRCVLDKNRVKGSFEGIQILSWDDIDEEYADVLIIASDMRYYETIYRRICYKCISRNLIVYSANGRCLSRRFYAKDLSKQDISYLELSKDRLLKKIDEYDVISFDLFDTLVMRRTLEPDDILDIVDSRLKRQGIYVNDYKKSRIEAELRLENANIYEIYDALVEQGIISKDDCDEVIMEELNCEEEMIIPRKVMIEVFKEAVRRGKRVYIITDIHLPADFISRILDNNSIYGYERVFISCEEKKNKLNGLYQIYKSTVKGGNYLHIGDNMESDYISAKRNGIDAFIVKNAYDMLRQSALRQCLICEKGINDRIIIGYIISHIYNDPFSLYRSTGMVRITNDASFGLVFFVSLILVYMQELSECINKDDYDGLLFGSRDCFLFYKLIQEYDFFGLKKVTKNHYIHISRKLAIKMGLLNSKDLEWYNGFFGSEEADKRALRNIFGDKVVKKNNSDNNYQIDEERLYSESALTREKYKRYLEKNGIDPNGNYIFCELLAQGTIQSRLNRMFNKGIMGFYIHRDYNERSDQLKYKSVYTTGSFCYDQSYVHYIEWIMTSAEPGTRDITDNGLVVYEDDIRTTEEINRVLRIQKSIEEDVQSIYGLLLKEKRINVDLARSLFEMIDHMDCTDENPIGDFKLRDEISQEYY